MDPATIAVIAAAASAANAGTQVYGAMQTNKNADRARAAARNKAALEQIQTNAEARQQRSLIQRKLALQIDASRVQAGAAGVSGGASQMVLESAYSQDARTDTATLSSNQYFKGIGISTDLTNNLTRIDNQTPSVGLSALQGVFSGLGAYMSVSQGLNSISGPRDNTGGATGGNPASNPDTIGGASQSDSIYAGARP